MTTVHILPTRIVGAWTASCYVAPNALLGFFTLITGARAFPQRPQRLVEQPWFCVSCCVFGVTFVVVCGVFPFFAFFPPFFVFFVFFVPCCDLVPWWAGLERGFYLGVDGCWHDCSFGYACASY
jgi:hypothetical protein